MYTMVSFFCLMTFLLQVDGGSNGRSSGPRRQLQARMRLDPNCCRLTPTQRHELFARLAIGMQEQRDKQVERQLLASDPLLSA